jgi:hypothetical protein
MQARIVKKDELGTKNRRFEVENGGKPNWMMDRETDQWRTRIASHANRHLNGQEHVAQYLIDGPG